MSPEKNQVKVTDLKLILVDPIEELCSAWRQEFDGVQAVSIVTGYFEELTDYDCLVSAGNSFGLMDGGVDLAIIRYFGLELMERVQEHIIQQFRGEQPVGTSFIIGTGHPQHPFLAHTPTMRVPMLISQTDNVYQAMWAMLLAVWQHNQKEIRKIRTVACPGLGTATGRMPFQRAAKHMALAYKNFLNPPQTISWPYAESRQTAIGSGGDVT
ncbi:macro domain-containing protein [Leptolyngbya sp. FACHB-261]|uniref:macro domain-containing protein n=1 Tax=Leptolyngbya sp. FACHB-261 TaxID=2692806 RepID=UPI0016825027|nr:macro domain-containing protein [Leptolyngbya sp. FACHB-261]MBD2099727.1 macro domain-containing protein [Leptolyngbya sp. FACHB-261]